MEAHMWALWLLPFVLFVAFIISVFRKVGHEASTLATKGEQVATVIILVVASLVGVGAVGTFLLYVSRGETDSLLDALGNVRRYLDNPVVPIGLSAFLFIWWFVPRSEIEGLGGSGGGCGGGCGGCGG